MSVVAGTIGGVLIARTLGNFVTKVSKRIFPFKGSSDEERIKYQNQFSEEQSEIRRDFEEKLHSLGLANQKDISVMTAFFNRQSSLQNSILSFSNTLKSKMFDEALRNYPLNIPPLVMLQNAGVSTNSVTGDLVVDDPIAKEILSVIDNGTNQTESLLSKYKNVLRHYPIALNIFVTPLLIDSRVTSKDKVSSLVWDNIFQNLESLLINEYNRCGERPVNFYPAAWNQNAKPGLHAAEILYFFTKGMPVVVLEPRYDGKQIRFIFSCWGIGSDPQKQIRQEITFDLNWNQVVLASMYERSVESLKKINQLKEVPNLVLDTKKKLEHNIRMYENLQEIDGIENNPITEDISKLFFLTSEDYSPLSKIMADALGISISLIADVHHLSTRGINPHFPELIESNFKDAFQSLTKPARRELMEAINGMVKSAYMELLLGEYDADNSYSSFELVVESNFELLDSAKGIMGNLETLPPSINENNAHSGSKQSEIVIEEKSPFEIIELINSKCNELNINESSLHNKVDQLKIVSPEFISYIEDLCERNWITLNDILK